MKEHNKQIRIFTIVASNEDHFNQDTSRKYFFLNLILKYESNVKSKVSEYTCSGRTHKLSHLSISHQLLLKTTNIFEPSIFNIQIKSIPQEMLLKTTNISEPSIFNIQIKSISHQLLLKTTNISAFNQLLVN